MEEEYITAEAVLAYYHGNKEKAKQAIVEAEMDGRNSMRDFCFLCGHFAFPHFWGALRRQGRSQPP